MAAAWTRSHVELLSLSLPTLQMVKDLYIHEKIWNMVTRFHFDLLLLNFLIILLRINVFMYVLQDFPIFIKKIWIKHIMIYYDM